MVLRRLLGWSMIDMTYLYLNETKAGAKRWDGKTFVDPPSFDDLPEKARVSGCLGEISSKPRQRLLQREIKQDCPF